MQCSSCAAPCDTVVCYLNDGDIRVTATPGCQTCCKTRFAVPLGYQCRAAKSTLRPRRRRQHHAAGPRAPQAETPAGGPDDGGFLDAVRLSRRIMWTISPRYAAFQRLRLPAVAVEAVDADVQVVGDLVHAQALGVDAVDGHGAVDQRAELGRELVQVLGDLPGVDVLLPE